MSKAAKYSYHSYHIKQYTFGNNDRFVQECHLILTDMAALIHEQYSQNGLSKATITFFCLHAVYCTLTSNPKGLGKATIQCANVAA